MNVRLHSTLRTVADGIDGVNLRIGHAVSWLTLTMVLVTVVVVVLRYGFNVGFIWMQESVRFMYAGVFLLAAGYTLLKDDHVRVDVMYRDLPERRKAIIDLAGTLVFLFPVCLAVLYFSWTYVLNSWAQFEGSLEERGLHAVYLLKTCIWAFAIVLILQGTSTIIRAVETLSKAPPR